MTILLNTLYVQRSGAHVRLDHDTLCVDVEGEKVMQIPLLRLQSVVLFGECTITSWAASRCVTDGIEVVHMTHGGRFASRHVGPTSGNVLLRLAHYDAHRDESRRLEIARNIVAAKIRNSRSTLQRGARDAKCDSTRLALGNAATKLRATLESTSEANDMNEVRGLEGEAARQYFGAFSDLITVDKSEFAFALRSRRPPRDRVNAMLSFVYALLVTDCVAALEGIGLDPQVGMLHCVRPGRPSLALDLAEEFRSCVADRLVLTLINRRQIQQRDFDVRDNVGGSVLLNEEGRRTVIAAYQERKQAIVAHPYLRQPVPIGLVPHVQARLLARHLRGDLESYRPFVCG
ncbi:MAG: type I-C CRISPR-associated endonuclease Cas1c [Coriobacteriia bacterium]